MRTPTGQQGGSKARWTMLMCPLSQLSQARRLVRSLHSRRPGLLSADIGTDGKSILYVPLMNEGEVAALKLD
jgi:hypothetical protein